jgi:Tol biopolymer transport system component/DNA-binding winged helix-turn-helix (wHTH) protein
MAEERKDAFLAGDWRVEPELNSLSKGDKERRVEPKVMKVLLTLASRPNHVFSKEELIAAVWPDTFVSDDVLTRSVSILRRITADDAHDPHFIQTIPKVGYRLLAPIAELPQTAKLPVEGEALADTLPSSSDLIFATTPVELGGPVRARRSPTLALVLISGSILLLAGAAFSVIRVRRTSINLRQAFRTTQFTSYAGMQTQPAFSPDGTQIAFVWTSEGGREQQIYVKRIGEETLTQLHPDKDAQFSPAWSPDGRRIAYLSKSSEGLGLYIADLAAANPAAGHEARKVFIPQEPSHWEQGALSWSPDGKSLIFPDHQGSQPNSSIFRLDLATNDVRSITSPPPGWEGDFSPVYSPDGGRIAFTRASETAVRDIYWMSVADGRLHQLTSDRTNVDSLTWDAAGSSVIFSSNRGGKYGLWKVGLKDAKPERLPVGAEDAFQPAVGPKPGQFAYAQGSSIWSIVRLRASVQKEGYPEPEHLLSSTQQDSAPSLSPDGEFFAMQSQRSGSQEIWISSIRGDSLRQLTFLGGPLTGSPSWSNRGDSILFDSRPDGHSHIFVVPAAGGKPKQLSFGNANDIVPRWSHDDQVIYFRSNRGGRWQLWKIAATGGEPQPVTSADGIEPQESPDGKWLYYTRGDEDGIWRMPTSGGPEVQISHQPAAGYWGYWKVEPRGIFYLDREKARASIRVLDPESKRTSLFVNLQQMPPLYSGITVVDQGRVVLMTDEHDAGRHITLVEAER